MKAKIVISLLSLIFLTVSCISTNQGKEKFFGYNNRPEYKKEATSKTKLQSSTPYVYNYSDDYDQRKAKAERPIYIFRNYYPAPYDPYFVYYDNPYEVNIFTNLYFPHRFDPFWDYYVVVVPYPHYRKYVVYELPYWDYHWYGIRPRYVYIPYREEPSKPRQRTVRDFGPSRGSYDHDRPLPPTKEKRTPSRSDVREEVPIKDKDATPKYSDEPRKVKIPEINTTNEPAETKKVEPKKSEPKTKEERSPTRPR